MITAHDFVWLFLRRYGIDSTTSRALLAKICCFPCWAIAFRGKLLLAYGNDSNGSSLQLATLAQLLSSLSFDLRSPSADLSAHTSPLPLLVSGLRLSPRDSRQDLELFWAASRPRKICIASPFMPCRNSPPSLQPDWSQPPPS